MTKLPVTAADKDALIASAAAVGIKVTRTSKDFFLEDGDDKARVTPTEIKRLIADAQLQAAHEEDERAEALALADEIREQEASGDVTDEVEVLPGEAPALQSVPVEEAVEAPADPKTSNHAQRVGGLRPIKEAKPKTEKAAKVVVKWGPPCGGDLGGVPAALHEEGRNPIVHLSFTPASTHKNKEEAAAAARRGSTAGWLAALAQDVDGTQFWIVATTNERGNLVLDGQEVRLELLTGKEAETYREKVKNARFKTKSQWVAQAI
ncbi:hypothetical protein [Deinococcus budaensis]|uniref:Uncharacterized protein n=1 Tax=Deinococcus budaensis TaxID=1665626 RepID=A0A7W8GF77_9DEIO|nr:hypothetical protein [Deinococcus budaensis]MBB5234507.1 hypothetical protein [Deinococcus budaensis]